MTFDSSAMRPAELAREMRTRGWSGAELARRAHISRALVSLLLSGNTPGRNTTWHAIRNALEDAPAPRPRR